MTSEEKLKRIRELWFEDKNSILSVYEIKAPYIKEEWEEIIEEMNQLLNVKE